MINHPLKFTTRNSHYEKQLFHYELERIKKKYPVILA